MFDFKGLSSKKRQGLGTHFEQFRDIFLLIGASLSQQKVSRYFWSKKVAATATSLL